MVAGRDEPTAVQGLQTATLDMQTFFDQHPALAPDFDELPVLTDRERQYFDSLIGEITFGAIALRRVLELSLTPSERVGSLLRNGRWSPYRHVHTWRLARRLSREMAEDEATSRDLAEDLGRGQAARGREPEGNGEN
jgi:hypothetical protein